MIYDHRGMEVASLLPKGNLFLLPYTCLPVASVASASVHVSGTPVSPLGSLHAPQQSPSASQTGRKSRGRFAPTPCNSSGAPLAINDLPPDCLKLPASLAERVQIIRKDAFPVATVGVDQVGGSTPPVRSDPVLAMRIGQRCP